MDKKYRTFLIIILMASPTIFAFGFLSTNTSHHVVTNERNAIFSALGEIYRITVSATSSSSSVTVQVNGDTERFVSIDSDLYTFYLPLEINDKASISISNSNDVKGVVEVELISGVSLFSSTMIASYIINLFIVIIIAYAWKLNQGNTQNVPTQI